MSRSAFSRQHLFSLEPNMENAKVFQETLEEYVWILVRDLLWSEAGTLSPSLPRPVILRDRMFHHQEDINRILEGTLFRVRVLPDQTCLVMYDGPFEVAMRQFLAKSRPPRHLSP